MKALLTLRHHFRRHRRKLLAGLVCILLSGAFQIALPVFVRHAIDGLQQHLSMSAIIRYVVLIAGSAALSGVFLYLTRQTIIVVSREIEYDMRNEFIAHVQLLSHRYFQETPTGDIMALATNDINAVRMFVGPAVMYSADTAFTTLLTLALMLSIHPLLTLYALIPLPFISWGVGALGKRIHHQFEDIQAHFGRLTTRAQENLAGMHVVKAYVREEYEIDAFRSLSWQYLKKNLRLARVQSLMMPLLGLLIGISVVVIVWLGGLEVIRGRLTLGELTQLVMYLGMLIWPMIAIGWVVNIIQRAAASAGRLNRMLDIPPEIADGVEIDRGIERIAGAIRFERASFRYSPQGPDVLSDIDLTIPAGTTLALVGYTGTGKSTLVQLLPRLFDLTGGRLLIDGHDVRTIPLAVLRANIGFVTQETFLFSDTIRANIAYGKPDATMEEIVAAAEIAQIHQNIIDFPDGYDTILGERGITLSGGQKQRTSIARAVLRKPAILVLDDALSAVDTRTEEAILERLRGVMRERTSIIISHRISTVKDADMIALLEGGRIVELGRHDELVARGGIYADLHYKQLLASELEEM